MRYEVLGPLRVTDGGAERVLKAHKVSLLLATLLVRADQEVSTDQLTAEIWGENPPRRATAGLHVYVSQLRKFLQRPERPDSPVVTRAPGYLLRVGDDELDLRVFQGLVETARGHARQERHQDCVDVLREALGLWRGPALGDLDGGPILVGFAGWLQDLHLESTELLVDSALALGRHRECVGMLHPLVAEHPLREAFTRQLMLALYRSECRADALKVYRQARRTIQDELGLEPGRPLVELHRAILASDAGLDAGRAADDRAPAGRPRPDVRHRPDLGSRAPTRPAGPPVHRRPAPAVAHPAGR